MPLIILLYFLKAQHVSGNTMPIIRTGACSPDTTPAYPHLTSNLQQTKNETTNVVINIIVASF